MVRSGALAIAWLDRAGRIGAINEAFGALTGDEEIRGVDWCERYVIAEDHARCRAWLTGAARADHERVMGVDGTSWRVDVLADHTGTMTMLAIGERAVALLAHENVVRNYLESTPDLVYAKDLSHRLLFANRAFANAHGRSPDELVGLLDTEIWPAEQCLGDPDRGIRGFRADDAEAFAGRTIRNAHASATFADGTQRIFETIKQPLYDDSGAIHGVLGLLRDVTERHRAEEAARASAERYRLLIDHAPVPIYVHDGVQVLLVNHAFAHMLRCREDELLGRRLVELVHPASRDVLRERIAALREGKTIGFNAPVLGQMLRSDSTVADVELVAAMIEYAGKPAIQVVMMDVTEREAAREELRARDAVLRKTAERLAAAQDIARIGSFELELATGALSWSDELYQICELPPTTPLVREAWTAVVHPDDRELLDRERARAFQTRTPATVTYRLRCGGGRIKHVEQHVRFVIDPDGNARLLSTIQDVTEREVAAAERARLAAQLLNAQRMEALGTLAAGIAHDFNNLLTIITANAAFIERDLPAPHPARECVAEVVTAATRGADLVRRILAAGRRSPGHKISVDASGVIAEASKLLRATLPPDVRVETSAAPDLPSIDGDPTQLHQVLMNLCTNAWHALDGPVKEISIRARGVAFAVPVAELPELPTGRYVEIEVRDTGSGIDAATLPRIFDPFFTTKPTGVGSGLGLAMVDGIVKSHGGAVVVESELGRGSRFRLYFPISETAVAATDAPRSGDTAQEASPLRVLLVDDEASIVRILAKGLRHAGYDVTAVTQAAQALAAVAEGRSFDAIVTDQRMPRMSGIELAIEVRKLAPAIPIVMMSGNLDDQGLAAARDVGIARFLDKPCTASDVATILEQIATRRR